MSSPTDALAQCRETNKRLNRRLQEAESALCEWRDVATMAQEQRTGRYSPALMAWAVSTAAKENRILIQALMQLADREESAAVALRSACNLYPGYHGNVNDYLLIAMREAPR